MKTMTNKAIYPMLLKPVPKEIIWGGTKLKEKYHKEAPFNNIAESWELTVRKNEKSVIDNGIYKGMYLSDYLEEEADDFPLLIKFIDAKDNLSVQVHPEDGGEDPGKTEMWYIIEADEDSGLVYGLNDKYTIKDFEKSVTENRTEDSLKYVNVREGDIFFIPAGQVHAIGGGILLAEIQQNSDTTYRIYDYHRKDKNGNERQLHIKEALASIKSRDENEISNLRFAKGKGENIVVSCDKFTVEKYTITTAVKIELNDWCAIVCVKGEGCIRHNDTDYPIIAGNTYYIPKGIDRIELSGDLTVLAAKA